MGNENVKLSIVVPCYNEAENLPLIYKRFKKVIGERDRIEVILVNNGSKDNSAEVFEVYKKDSAYNVSAGTNTVM